MANLIKVTVVSLDRAHPCSAGIQVGDSFTVDAEHCLTIKNQTIKCLELLHNVTPAIMTMAHGGKLPWEKNGKAMTACNDPFSKVVVTVERVS
ncbi:MAG TPA: TIGR04076 family protein [Bacillota bacterium]|jgi:uncharacterized repeat protein (TIGR04076 family)